MPSVALSDHLYRQAEQAAKTNGLSLEEFVARTLEAGIDHEPLALTSGQATMVRKGQADLAAGRVSTFDEIDARLVEKKRVWLAENQG